MTGQQPRLPFLDVARGLALVAMAIYHFGWDIAFFGYVDPVLVNDGPWKIFARCIASSFLFLVGIGLILAHHHGIKWQGFWKRWLKVAAAALIITVATLYFTPDAFIFFGILHQIAFASLFGLLFLRPPWFALLALGAAWILAAPYFVTPALDGWHLAWTGLQAEPVRSNDFVPVFPWFGAVLLGMGCSKIMLRTSAFGYIAARDRFSESLPGKALGFLGRHSLLTYLIHQPILIALIYVFSQIVPAQIDIAKLHINFAESCQTGCEANNSMARCAFYCACVEDRLDDANLFTPIMTGELAFDAGEPAQITQQCNIEMVEIPEEQNQ